MDGTGTCCDLVSTAYITENYFEPKSQHIQYIMEFAIPFLSVHIYT
jgi:hypothetical protein